MPKKKSAPRKKSAAPNSPAPKTQSDPIPKTMRRPKMTNDRTTPQEESGETGFAATLDRHPAAAWIIDPAAGAILAANPAGIALLAHAPEGSDEPFPALARLRELAANPAALKAPRDEQLPFWTEHGIAYFECEVHLLERRGKKLLVVAEKPPVEAPSALDLPDDDAESADRSTMQAIAQRIRDAVAEKVARLNRNDKPEAVKGGKTAATPQDSPRLAELAQDLKMPLAAIAAAAEVLRDERLGPLGHDRYRSYAADICESAQHALTVIAEILGHEDDALPDAPLDFCEVDLDILAASLVASLQPLAGRNGLTLSGSWSLRLPRVVADATSVRQMLFNLVSNALQTTPSGGRITVVTRYTLDGPVLLTVEDTGRGMSAREIAAVLAGTDVPSEIAKALPVGTQGTKPAKKLGLPLVRDLAAANGAELTLAGTPGKGTTATLIFPKSRVVPV